MSTTKFVRYFEKFSDQHQWWSLHRSDQFFPIVWSLGRYWQNTRMRNFWIRHWNVWCIEGRVVPLVQTWDEDKATVVTPSVYVGKGHEIILLTNVCNNFFPGYTFFLVISKEMDSHRLLCSILLVSPCVPIVTCIYAQNTLTGLQTWNLIGLFDKK